MPVPSLRPLRSSPSRLMLLVFDQRDEGSSIKVDDGTLGLTHWWTLIL